MTLWCLGHIAQQQGDFTTALEYLQESFEILQRIKSPDAEKMGELISEVQFNQLLEQSPEAQQLYQQLESADEDTRNQIFARLRELMNNEYGNG